MRDLARTLVDEPYRLLIVNMVNIIVGCGAQMSKGKKMRREKRERRGREGERGERERETRERRGEQEGGERRDGR